MGILEWLDLKQETLARIEAVEKSTGANKMQESHSEKVFNTCEDQVEVDCIEQDATETEIHEIPT